MRWIASLILPPLMLIGACASKPAPAPVTGFTFESAEYARVFAAARETLREQEFELERVDAANGVITTRPRGWAGFMTPWIPFGQTGKSTLEGFVQNERRVAKVQFSPVEPQAEGAEVGDVDLREYEGSIKAEVEVEVDHVERPHKRVSVASARLTSYATDPELVKRGKQPAYAYAAGDDPDQAAHIAELIQKGMKENAAIPKTE
ncbi:MAG TPA: hypothetical protein VG797_00805 [Phycisphaerales bacterium]|nr:hypothetical protein [Phycisphaerales bacterium]